ncbi:hypothetical protein DIPPA_17170 [Diplonema papillatum]|nr:hypothetical protein DIPPA_17170 [Diplonema papillatum]
MGSTPSKKAEKVSDKDVEEHLRMMLRQIEPSSIICVTAGDAITWLHRTMKGTDFAAREPFVEEVLQREKDRYFAAACAYFQSKAPAADPSYPSETASGGTEEEGDGFGSPQAAAAADDGSRVAPGQEVTTTTSDQLASAQPTQDDRRSASGAGGSPGASQAGDGSDNRSTTSSTANLAMFSARTSSSASSSRLAAITKRRITNATSASSGAAGSTPKKPPSAVGTARTQPADVSSVKSDGRRSAGEEGARVAMSKEEADQVALFETDEEEERFALSHAFARHALMVQQMGEMLCRMHCREAQISDYHLFLVKANRALNDPAAAGRATNFWLLREATVLERCVLAAGRRRPAGAAILPAHAACRRQLCVAELEHRRAVAAAKAAESRAIAAPAVRRTRLCNREAWLRRETEAAEVTASDSLFAAAVPSVGSSSPVRASFVDAWACAVSDEEEVGRQELEDEVFGQRSVFCDTPGFFARLDEEKRMLLLRYPAAVSDSDSDDSWV